MAGGLVDNFLNAFMSAHQMQMQQQAMQNEQIRYAVQDAIRQQQVDQMNQWHQEEVNRYNQDREVRQQAADTAQQRADDAAKKNDEAAKAATERNDRMAGAQALQNWQRTGGSLGMNLDVMGVSPQKKQAALQSQQTAMSAQTNKQNAQTMGQDAMGGMAQALSAILPSVLGAAGGGMSQAIQTAAPPIQPLQPQPTLEDAANAQAPAFLATEALKHSLATRNEAQGNYYDTRSEHIQNMEDLDKQLTQAHIEQATAMAHRAETQNQFLPKELQTKINYQNGMLDVAKTNAYTNQLREQATASNLAGVNARAEANRASIFLNQQASQVKDFYQKAKAAEDKAAQMNAVNGNFIKAQTPIVNQLKAIAVASHADPKAQMNYISAQKELSQAQALWDANNSQMLQPDGSMKSRIQMLTEDRKKWENEWKNSLAAAGNMDAIYKRQVDQSGTQTPMPTQKMKGLPQVGNLGPATQPAQSIPGYTYKLKGPKGPGWYRNP